MHESQCGNKKHETSKHQNYWDHSNFHRQTGDPKELRRVIISQMQRKQTPEWIPGGQKSWTNEESQYKMKEEFNKGMEILRKNQTKTQEMKNAIRWIKSYKENRPE